jgi:hypothetical protein
LKSAQPGFRENKSRPSGLFGGDHFFHVGFDFVGVVTLDANDHEGAVSLAFAIADQVAKGATARERGFAVIFVIFLLFQCARTDIRCKNRAGEKKQDEPFGDVHHGLTKLLEPGYIGINTKNYIKTHEKQALNRVYDSIVIRPPRLGASPWPGQQ